MSRIACLRIPRFPIAVHQKHEPELYGKPFVLISANPVRPKVMASSSSCRQNFAGMKLSEAKAVEKDLSFRLYDQALYASAQKELLPALLALSPKVWLKDLGLYLLDASGLSYLGGEKAFCHLVLKQVSKAGFRDACLGIADSAFAATVAAKHKHKRFYIVPYGQDKEFLAPLPIQHLSLESDTEESLLALGIDCLGKFAGIAPSALCQRFGNDALLLLDLALGQDPLKPQLPEKVKEFHAFIDLAWPVLLVHELVFILRPMLEEISRKLSASNLAAEELLLGLYKGDRCFEKRPIKLVNPSHNVKLFLEIVKLTLEAKPAEAEITGIEIAVTRFVQEPQEQLSLNKALFAQAEDQVSGELSPALILLIERLQKKLGEKALVRPKANDQYLPETSAFWVSVGPGKDEKLLVPQAKPLPGPFVLRKLNQTFLVELENAFPRSVLYNHHRYQIKHIAGPECLSGHWWADPYRRSYYVALLAATSKGKSRFPLETAPAPPPALALLVLDHQKKNWFVEGFFD